MLSELTRAAGVVLTAKIERAVDSISSSFGSSRRSALAILVAEDGQVENRIINVPMGLPASSLTEAANFLNAHVRGCTLAEARAELEKGQAVLPRPTNSTQLTQKIIAAGPRELVRGRIR